MGETWNIRIMLNPTLSRCFLEAHSAKAVGVYQMFRIHWTNYAQLGFSFNQLRTSRRKCCQSTLTHHSERILNNVPPERSRFYCCRLFLLLLGLKRMFCGDKFSIGFKAARIRASGYFDGEWEWLVWHVLDRVAACIRIIDMLLCAGIL